MTTSAEMSLKSVIHPDEDAIEPWQIGYLTAAAQDESHELVLSAFQGSGHTKAYLARRLGKKPEQITRWLGSPGNWTLGTLVTLLAAMGFKISFSLQKLSELKWADEHHPAVAARHSDPVWSARVESQPMTTLSPTTASIKAQANPHVLLSH